MKNGKRKFIFLFQEKKADVSKILLLIHPRKNDNNEKDNIFYLLFTYSFGLYRRKNNRNGA